MTARPWPSVRTPLAPLASSASLDLPVEIDLSELREAPSVPPPSSGALPEGESSWDARAALAFEMSRLRESFSKSEVDAIIVEAERLGMSFTSKRTYVVTFDGQNFTLSRNTVFTRVLFRLDSYLRRFARCV